MPPNRALSALKNFATVAVLAVAAKHFIWERAIELRYAVRSRVGLKVVRATDSAVTADGLRHPIASRDSVTLLLLSDAECGPCRDDIVSFVRFAGWASVQGMASRLLLPDDDTVLVPLVHEVGGRSVVMAISPEWFERLGIRRIPSVILVDRRGIVRGKWLGDLPPHLAILNVVGNMLRSPDDIGPASSSNSGAEAGTNLRKVARVVGR